MENQEVRDMRRRNILIRTSIIIMCFVLCGTADMLYAEEDLKYDISFRFSALGLQNSLGYGAAGLSGSFGYRFSSHLFADIGTSFYPGNTRTARYTKTMAFGGIRAGTELGNRQKRGFFANARSGVTRIDGKAYPFIDLGLSIEFRRSEETKRDPRIRGNNLFFRIDVASRMIFFDDAIANYRDHGKGFLGTYHHPLIELGIGTRF